MNLYDNLAPKNERYPSGIISVSGSVSQITTEVKETSSIMLHTPPIEHIAQFFEYTHLPKHLQEVSKPFCELADEIIKTLPQNPERTVALRKLLESKDAAVRAKLAKKEKC